MSHGSLALCSVAEFALQQNGAQKSVWRCSLLFLVQGFGFVSLNKLKEEAIIIFHVSDREL